MISIDWQPLTARRRTYITREKLGTRYDPYDPPGEERIRVPADEATLISSQETGTDMHLPRWTWTTRATWCHRLPPGTSTCI